MLLIRHVYNVLLVSSAGKLNTAILTFFDAERFEPVTVVDTVARAQRMLAEREYDLVIINAPLPDDFGRRLAVDVCTDSGRVALLIVRSDIYDETWSAMTPHGVLVAKRPMERSVMEELLDVMCTVRERLRGVQKKTMSMEEKMAEIRQVNRAKWALISACHMTEEEAHRYIQKQAMDLCISKKEAAENILRTYG